MTNNILNAIVNLATYEFKTTEGLREFVRTCYAENYIPALFMFRNGYVNYKDGVVTKTPKFIQFYNKVRCEANKACFSITGVSLAGNRNSSQPRIDISYTIDGVMGNYLYGSSAFRYNSAPESMDFYLAIMQDKITQKIADWVVDHCYKSNIRNSKIMTAFLKKKNDTGNDTIDFNWMIKLLQALKIPTKPLHRDDNLLTVPRLEDKLAEMKDECCDPKTMAVPVFLQSYLVDGKHLVVTHRSAMEYEVPDSKLIEHYEGLLFRQYNGKDINVSSLWLSDMRYNVIDILDGDIKHKEHLVKDLVPLYEAKFIEVFREHLNEYKLLSYNCITGSVNWYNDFSGGNIKYTGKEEYSNRGSSYTHILRMCERLGLIDELVDVLAKHTHPQVIQDLMVHALEGKIVYQDADASTSYPIRKLIGMIADKQEGK